MMLPRPSLVGLQDTVAAEDDGPGREVRALHDRGQVGEVEVRVVDQRHRGVDDLAQIVRRDVGRHADGDAAGAVDQQVRVLRRQDRGLLAALVVVGPEVDRVLVDVGEQGVGDLGEPGLGVAHGRRRIAVHRAEIALPVDQRQAHAEVLRHADHARHRSRESPCGWYLPITSPTISADLRCGLPKS